MRSRPGRAEEATGQTCTHIIRAPRTDDIFLGILEKRASRIDRKLPPVLLIHGATLGAKLFDLPAPGYSLMAELACHGRAVYALDIRGYGNSLNGLAMNAPPEANPPFARITDAVSDIGAAARFILERDGVDNLDLVGFSWGTVTAASYATANPAFVRRFALYAPLYAEFNAQWLDRIADPDDRTKADPKMNAYRYVTIAELTRRWDSDFPGASADPYREKGVLSVMFGAMAALDPHAGSHIPPAFRVPNGALADLVNVFNGRPLYDAGKLTMPVLLVRGQNDRTATDTDARRLLSAIASRDKQYCVISPGSHFLCIEKKRFRLYEQLNRFLARSSARSNPGNIWASQGATSRPYVHENSIRSGSRKMTSCVGLCSRKF